jgi:hypothetical protein
VGDGAASGVGGELTTGDGVVGAQLAGGEEGVAS